MALFINVDPVAPHWWKRKVYRGWQFGYSGGTKNDFIIDIEVARYRFVCYIGFKQPMNPSSRQARHAQWRKEEERARERANRPESAFKRFWRSLRGIKASGHRMDQKRTQNNKTPADAGLVLAGKRFLRFIYPAPDRDYKRGRQLAARAGLPKPIHRNAVAPIEGELLRQEYQGQPPKDDHLKDPEAGGLSREKTP